MKSGFFPLAKNNSGASTANWPQQRDQQGCSQFGSNNDISKGWVSESKKM